jgi:hypothetical protein
MGACGGSYEFVRFLFLRNCLIRKLSIICFQLTYILRIHFHFHLAVFIPLRLVSQTFCTVSLDCFARLVLDGGNYWLANTLITFDFIHVTLIFVIFWRVSTLRSCDSGFSILIIICIFADLQICFWSEGLLIIFPVCIHNIKIRLIRFSLRLIHFALHKSLWLVLFHLWIPLNLQTSSDYISSRVVQIRLLHTL